MKPSSNPFRSSAIARQRYVISESEFTGLLTELSKMNYQASIMGPHGTGKSVLLEDLRRALESSGKSTRWFYLYTGSSRRERLATLLEILRSPGEQICCLDGGETIGGVIWNMFLLIVQLKRTSLLATTHRPCFLAALYETRADLDHALMITSNLAGADWNEEMENLAAETFRKHSGNCREIFRSCYLYCSEL